MAKSKPTTAPAPAEKPAGKAPAAAPAAAEKAGKRRRKANTTSFATYIYKVLRTQNKDLGITKKSMNIMDQFCMDVFERIASEAGRLARYGKRQTISAKQMQFACQLCLPGELAKHANSEATKAVTRYNNNNQ